VTILAAALLVDDLLLAKFDVRSAMLTVERVLIGSQMRMTPRRKIIGVLPSPVPKSTIKGVHHQLVLLVSAASTLLAQFDQPLP
jgi:hypothetical protein